MVNQMCEIIPGTIGIEHRQGLPWRNGASVRVASSRVGTGRSMQDIGLILSQVGLPWNTLPASGENGSDHEQRKSKKYAHSAFAPDQEKLVSGFQDQLLHAPVQQLSDVQFVFRRTGNFVNPSKLLELLARLARASRALCRRGLACRSGPDRHRSCTAPDWVRGVMQIAQGDPACHGPLPTIGLRRLVTDRGIGLWDRKAHRS